MENYSNAKWYIVCDIIVELTLFHMTYGTVSIVTDSVQSPNTVTGSTSKEKYINFY